MTRGDSRVLLVEDDSWQSDVYRRQLERTGIVTATASSPQEALMTLDGFTPDIIVADVLLEGNSIFSLLHEIATYEDTRSIPVVLMTTEASLLEGADLSGYGVVELIDKSTMGVDAIVLAVRRWLHES